MLIIEVKDKGIEKALKEYKRKHSKVKIAQELRERKEFTKPSVKRRSVIKKAKYIQSLWHEENI
jgi:small subunit ribosomal protein S21